MLLNLYIYFLILENRYISLTALSRYIDVTYSHILVKIRDFEEAGLILTEKNGRYLDIFFTQKGEETLKQLKKLVELLEL
jgi:DNA-binding MarR family transcriptional regulator